MDKPAIHLKYIISRITSFFDVLGKANHRPNCADEVILTRSDDLVQPTIGWSSFSKKDGVNNGWAMEQLPFEEVKIDIANYACIIYIKKCIIIVIIHKKN